MIQSQYKLKNGRYAMVWGCPNCYADIYEGFDDGFEFAVKYNTCPDCGHKDNTGNPLEARANWQTKARGSNEDEYEIYLACANDGVGGDITRGGAPLLTFDEWMAR